MAASSATERRMAPFGQAKTQIPHPSQAGPIPKLTAATRSRETSP
jgi:hypothetical protein